MECLIQILRLFAEKRDVEAVLVLDQDLAVPIEEDTARCGKREAPEVILGRHFREPVVLRNLEDPEPDRQRGKQPRDDVLNHRQPRGETATIVGHEGRGDCSEVNS